MIFKFSASSSRVWRSSGVATSLQTSAARCGLIVNGAVNLQAEEDRQVREFGWETHEKDSCDAASKKRRTLTNATAALRFFVGFEALQNARRPSALASGRPHPF